MSSTTVPFTPVLNERFAGLHRLIGNTPLLAIDVIFRGEPRVIFAKQESLNLTGSIKDRMALWRSSSSKRRIAAAPCGPGCASLRPPAATPASRSPPSAVRWGTR